MITVIVGFLNVVAGRGESGGESPVSQDHATIPGKLSL